MCAAFLYLATMIAKWRGKFKILILGASRGGTSLVASLLDSHPRLTVGNEEFAASYLEGAGLSANELRAEQRLDRFIKNCQREAGRVPGLWGNKITTEQLDILGAEEEAIFMESLLMKKLFARRRIIFVVRDGRSCVYSKMQRSGTDYDICLERWKRSVQWLQFLRAKDVSIRVVRFEELLRRPEEQLSSLCEFLKLNYNPSMMEGTASHRLAEEYRQKGVNVEKAFVPSLAMPYTDDMRQELSYLGYM